jgi:hypothetical protein
MPRGKKTDAPASAAQAAPSGESACGILDYLARAPEHADLLQIITACCAGGLVSAPAIEGVGVTLLIPPADVVAGMKRDVEAGRFEPAETALKSYILPVCLLAPKPGESVGNKLAVLIGTVEGSGSEISLGPLRLQRVDGFAAPGKRCGSHCGRAALWRVLSGVPPTDGTAWRPEARPRKPRKPRDGETAGGAAGGDYEDEEGEYEGGCDMRRGIYERVVRSMAAPAGGAAGDASLVAAASFLRFLHKRHAADFASVAQAIDPSPLATLYLLLEPYRTGGDFLVPSAVIADWNSGITSDVPFADYQAALAEARKTVAPGYAQAKDAAVSDLLHRGSRTLLMAAVTPKYDARAAGSIGGAAPSHDPQRLMWMDEVRFAFGVAAVAGGGYGTQAFLENVANIPLCYPGCDFQLERKLLNQATWISRVGMPLQEWSFLTRFLTSSAFLYAPAEPASSNPDFTAVERYDNTPFDFAFYMRGQLARFASVRTGLAALLEAASGAF